MEETSKQGSVDDGKTPGFYRGYGEGGSKLREITTRFAVWGGEPPEGGPAGHWVNPTFVYHHDDERYDEIKVFPVERYKTSDLSGDEWRFGIHVQVLWKGIVLGQQSYSSFEAATRELDHYLHFTEQWFKGCSANSQGKIRIVDTGERIQYCFQPGCRNTPVSVYRLKFEYDRNGNKTKPHCPKLMLFCKNHLKRGDCGLEDADINYEVLEGPGPEENDWVGLNVTESM